ncbi:hypothetical protein RRG08_037101 [Elysia crispata]|uniref:Uncharacterized protein n=1 Tax=Elysia crispata TaxID=231223 RepID=A0AAE0Y544_9GAST|nr:hypothetical protein RRG08_037101 [Elysia crispata]
MPFFEHSKLSAAHPTLCEVTYDLDKRCGCDVHEKSHPASVSRDLPPTWTRSMNHVTGFAQASCAFAGYETVSLYSGPSSFYDMLKNYYWDNSYNQGGSPSQTPLPVRPNTTLTIYTSHPPGHAGTSADTVGGGSAPGFGHAYYSRRAAVANNASSDRDSFLPSLFRGGADNASSGDQNVQQQLQGGLAGEVATAGWKEERSRKAKLRWVDALNTWVPEKKPLTFITTSRESSSAFSLVRGACSTALAGSVLSDMERRKFHGRRASTVLPAEPETRLCSLVDRASHTERTMLVQAMSWPGVDLRRSENNK